ncbi:MAG: hypothetical protein SWY16_26870 [Cyanobacteriota bacterium]|nr:hypothetical protein [Cyanobacteriota bacterium]
MKIRKIEVTVNHAESERTEVQTLTFLFDDRAEKYELTKVYVVELGKKVIFSKSENLVILPD